MEAQSQRDDIFNVLQEGNHHLEFHTQENYLPKRKERKKYSQRKELRKFVTSGYLLTLILKDIYFRQ